MVAARDPFLEAAGDVKDLRDALMHLDDKVIRANTSGMGRPAEVDLKFERIMDGDLELRIGGNVVRAWAGTRAAEELAEALRPVTWEQGESAGAPRRGLGPVPRATTSRAPSSWPDCGMHAEGNDRSARDDRRPERREHAAAEAPGAHLACGGDAV